MKHSPEFVRNTDTLPPSDDINDRLDSVPPSEWAKTIYLELDDLLDDSAKYGAVVLKIARRYLSGYDAYGNRGNREFLENFFSGVPEESVYDKNWKRFVDCLYETMDSFGKYGNRYITSKSTSPDLENPALINDQESLTFYDNLLYAKDDEFVNQVASMTKEDFSRFSSAQIGEIIYRLVLSPGFDEFSIFPILRNSLLASEEGGAKFIIGFEVMVTKYSHTSTGQQGIFAIYSLWEAIARSADHFNFQVFFDSTLRMYGHSAVDPYLKMRFILELNKWLIGSSDFTDLIVKKINLSAEANDDTSVLLDLLRKLSSSDRRQGSAVVVSEIVARCEEKCPEAERNYFLQAQLSSIKNSIKKYTGATAAYTPLYIGDSQYIIYDPYGATYVSNRDNFHLLKSLVKHAYPGSNSSGPIPVILRSENEDDFYENGTFEKHEDFVTASGEDFIKIAQKYGFRFFSSEDLAGVKNAENVISEQEIAEYLYMMQPEMRLLLADSFGIDLTKLSRAEQFHFLAYVKQTSVDSADTMRAFIKAYGIDAMRSFLATSYDESASENIMIFGTMTEYEIAAKIFSSYSRSIDSTNAFGEKLRASNPVSSPISALSQELSQGMIKRAGHLMRAAKEISLSEYNGEESMLDLVQAYEGVARIMEILAYIEDSDKYYLEKTEVVVGDPSMQTVKHKIVDDRTKEKYTLKVAVRPRATERAEARINFELSLDQLSETEPIRQSFQQTINHKGVNGGGARRIVGSVIRFGFDLDSRTNPPVFSFDMGRDAYQGDGMTRTGDVLGRILSMIAPDGHHLQDFSTDLSKADNFALIADAIAQRFSIISPTEDAEPQYYLF